jgi:hypothetical protein
MGKSLFGSKVVHDEPLTLATDPEEISSLSEAGSCNFQM